MRKEDIPEPSASTFKEAQEFIHEYRLSQWRLTRYLVAINVLMAEGTMPTDTSIARHLSDARTQHAVANTMKSLVKSGLVKITGETARGKAYRLTAKGEQAIVRIRQINNAWEKLWEDRIDPPAPDYSKAFERLNHTIKTLEETVASQKQALAFQNEVIAGLRRQLASNGGGDFVSSVKPKPVLVDPDSPPF